MKLLLLDQFSDPGGAQQCLVELLPAIRERGWQCLVGLPGDGGLFERIREMGFETAHVDCGPFSSGAKSWNDMARFAAGTPKLARQIRGLAESLQADVVYLNGPRLLPAAALAGLRCPVVFHSHSYLGPGASLTLAGRGLGRMDAHVVATCRFVAEPWRAFVPAERLSVVLLGVPGATAIAPRPRPGPPRVGCLGRIAPEKGQREFLAAAAIIHRAIPDCRFAIYGAPLFSGGDYEEHVRADAAELPVEFAGWVEDIHAALAGLDLVLVPSAAHEATTRVILEAFAAGVPVVAFRSGGIPEILEHGCGGWLAESAAEMAVLVIEFFAADSVSQAAASQAALDNWRQKYTLERYHRELLNRLDVIHSTES